MKLDDWLTATEAAEIMGLTRQHVGGLCRNGALPGAQKLGRYWVIPRSSVEAYEPGPQGFAAVWDRRKKEEDELAAEIEEALRKQK